MPDCLGAFFLIYFYFRHEYFECRYICAGCLRKPEKVVGSRTGVLGKDVG